MAEMINLSEKVGFVLKLEYHNKVLRGGMKSLIKIFEKENNYPFIKVRDEFLDYLQKDPACSKRIVSYLRACKEEIFLDWNYDFAGI